MDTILEEFLNKLNIRIGFAGSLITLYDHFKNQDQNHIKETFQAIRNKSKEAYDSYCEYCECSKNDIGKPVKENILRYWESCLERDALPSVDDMVSLNIASKEEAEVMLTYLMEAWMEIPDFVEWLHDVLAQNKLDELLQMLISLQKNLEGISGLKNELKQQDISNVAFIISSNDIVDAKYSCTDLDVKCYYMVDNRFSTMLKVISAQQDIPHMEAAQKTMELVEGSRPVIIAGNAGLGKSSLMMRVAVQWASRGGIAVWLSLSNRDVITEKKADAFFNQLIASIPGGQRALLCIDNPYEGKSSFSNLRRMCPNNKKIQLIMAERANRLTALTDSDQDFLLHWFDDAQMVVLQGLEQSAPTFELKDYVSCYFSETQVRRKKILEKCTYFLVREGIVEEKDKLSIIQSILHRYSKSTVSLVELIYRTLFELKERASKPEDIKLDWEEWESFIEYEFGKSESHIPKELYGVIAAFKIFNIPMTTKLFCKYFELKEGKLKNRLNSRLMSHHSEPVIFRNDTLQPKHDVIAELFFLFHEKTVSINSIMLNLLQCMDEDEIEALLVNIVNKKELKKGKRYCVGQIKYRDYMDEIYNRRKEHSCNLSKTGMAYLCLGYLWSRFQQNSSERNISLNDILNEIAPEIDGTIIMAKLYTEWGIWARISGMDALAEEKYRIVIDNYPREIPARTELGKLFSKQRGREKEAEEVLREVINIDSKDIKSRTELGKLLAKQRGREKEAEEVLRKIIEIDSKNIMARTELGKLFSKQRGRGKEAEEVLREVIKIDSKNIMARTELGKLFSKQKGRRKEAEKVLWEVIDIDPKDIKSRTELGKLFSKQRGREKEAEDVLLEVIDIDPKNLHARTVLAELYEDCNRQAEAVILYQEICKYNPGDPYGKRGMERLKEYIKE